MGTEGIEHSFRPCKGLVIPLHYAPVIVYSAHIYKKLSITVVYRSSFHTMAPHRQGPLSQNILLLLAFHKIGTHFQNAWYIYRLSFYLLSFHTPLPMPKSIYIHSYVVIGLLLLSSIYLFL